jgi:preprotein translocase subunit SecE
LKKLLIYFKESWQEVGKITWPNRQQTIRLTVAVTIFSLVFGIFFGLADIGLSEALKRVVLRD